MYLEKLEIFGFKSFAQRLFLKFSPGIACIIGPNGSGKSNLLEAIRWTMGEQSLKNLRSKKSEDVIFSGAQNRLNFAEVSLYLNNPHSSSQELVITRKITRSGENEYFINRERTKLHDLLLLISKENFGPKSYSVIGQGMVDSILYSSPLERKEFFIEATGIKKYQIKRREAILKLKKTQENFNQASVALKEIEPRMKFLTRQIKKLSKRQEIEKKLIEYQKKYYGSKRVKLENEEKESRKEIVEKKEEIKEKFEKLKILQKNFRELSSSEGGIKFFALQKDYQTLLDERKKIIENISILKTESIFSSKDKEKSFKVIRIKEDLKKIIQKQEILISKLEKIEKIEDLKELKIDFTKTIEELKSLAGLSSVKEYPSFSKELEEKEKSLKNINRKIEETEINFGKIFEEEEEKRKEIIEEQEEIQKKQEEISHLEFDLKEKEIEIAKLETKKEDLENEIKRDCLDIKILTFLENKLLGFQEEEELFLKIKKLKHHLEMIEAIDPGLFKEHQECSQRYNFLSSQTGDLKKAIDSLKKIEKKFSEKIKNEFFSNFNKINQEFKKYFKILFQGGTARLLLEEKKENEIEGQVEEENSEEEDWLIEIQARPPGKRIKALETLSGGERAFSSLALILAIIKIKNPPFVILDEVDAALDEINSFRLVKILKDLAKKIQFIIITHNNKVIEEADIIYGVTMKGDGTSFIVSLKLEGV